MAKKAKKRKPQMPPLSFADKAIYAAAALLLCAAYFALGIVFFYLRDRIAFSDDTVIAATESLAVGWFFVPWLIFFLITFIPFVSAYESRRPIFGRKGLRYGPPTYPKVYPLFMKNKPREQKGKGRIAILLLLVLLIGLIPLPWSLCARSCLRCDGSVVKYNGFNRQSREWRPEDFSEIRIETFRFRYTTGKHIRSYHWGVQMVLRTSEGKQYKFDHGDFRGDVSAEDRYWLEAMLDIKRYYDPHIISCSGIENLSHVIANRTLSPEETEMLYQLFGQ